MTTSEERREIARARERADLARLRFGNAVTSALHRVTPDRLKADAIEEAREQINNARRDLMKRFRYWPVALGAVGVGAAALIFWKPARVVAQYGARAVGLAWTGWQLWRRMK